MSADFRHPGHATLQRYVLGESGADERLAVEQHLAGCPECDALVDADRRLDAWLVESASGPVPRGTGRATFDRLWAAVDAEAGDASAGDGAPTADARAGAEPAVAARGAPVTRLSAWRRVAVLAAAALLIVALRSLFMVPDPGRGGGTGDAGPILPPVADEEPVPAPDRDEHRARPGGLDLRPREPEATPPGSTLDPARLARARSEVADALVTVDTDFPSDDVAFRLACDDRLEALRREGWPVTHLVRDHALDEAAAARPAALRYAALDPESAPTLVRALDRSRDAQDALWALSGRADDTPLAPSVARALGRLLDARRHEPFAEVDELALRLLERPGGEPERIAAAGRARAVVERTGTAEPALERALRLVATLPARDAVEALAALAVEPGLRAVADAALLARARIEPLATGLALGALPSDRRLSPGAVEWAIEWAVGARLDAAAPGLVAALTRDPEDAALLDAVHLLAGADVALPLFELWREQRHRRAGLGLQLLVVSLLDADAAARRALGAGLPPRALDDLVDLLDQLGPGRAGDALLAFLATDPPSSGRGRERDTARASALSTLARLGDAADVDGLLAWIDDAHDTDRTLLAHAWATAAVLDGQTSLDAWTGQGREPAVLASAGAERSWPTTQDKPPTRLLRDLDRSLRQAARTPSPADGVTR